MDEEASHSTHISSSRRSPRDMMMAMMMTMRGRLGGDDLGLYKSAPGGSYGLAPKMIRSLLGVRRAKEPPRQLDTTVRAILAV